MPYLLPGRFLDGSNRNFSPSMQTVVPTRAAIGVSLHQPFSALGTVAVKSQDFGALC